MTIPMYGVTNWVVKTNAWGFRGDEVSRERTPGISRIAMVGDSITDGFYVENPETYPAATRDHLLQAGFEVEVINAANGGSSIDRQLAIFKDVVTAFQPDIVVLTFVTNDISGLADVDDEALLESRAARDAPTRKLVRFLFVDTAVGEWVLDTTLRFISRDYAENQEKAKRLPELARDRYAIPGGDQFQANARGFMKRYVDTDGQVLQDQLPAAVQHEVDRYLLACDAFMEHASRHGIQPVFVYFPAYPQVYDPAVSMKIRDLLREHSQKQRVPFLDLTPALREHGANQVLHLAPKDFHLNPEGNRVIGEALADFLITQGLIKPSR
jgi:lysophospholipase L1-like esterase